jgi:uncharacterized protein
MDDEVVNNAAELRYELASNAGLAVAAYEYDGDVIVFTHTQVPASLEGHGIGSRLVEGALADVRSKGLKLVAACSFVAGYLQRHPADQDLIA